ncbi:diacylglycerol kinase [Ligilactobacillus pobuzihii]|uniref:diacylglycerol/lipid kinase family protein n=1 Tax=Ligilactobacillus pobuzihii TaxID=449659 RepID=UPI0019CF9B70|nr:diacylglycerol kinase family protein [Ligilactobacillus pobuzihii]MBN7274863.1 diacylglycerol kinase [Ligilactobacillus pobuzihii]
MALTYGIFYNKNSGHGHAEKKAKICQKKLLAADHQVEMINDDSLAKSQNHLAKKLSDLDFLVIVGGDGTLNGALSVIVKYDHPLPVGVIPAGTVNNFAKRYHLALETNAAIQTILDVPQIRYVGLGKCGKDKAIVSSLTFGNLANISNKVRQQDKQKFGLGVYLTKAFRQIGHDKSYLIEYQLGKNRVKTLRTWFALITTTRSVGGFPYDTGASGKMHVSLLNDIHVHQVWEYIRFAMTGRLRASKNITAFTTQKLTLTPKDNKIVSSRIDGDQGPQLPLTVSFLPEYLPLIVPS